MQGGVGIINSPIGPIWRDLLNGRLGSESVDQVCGMGVANLVICPRVSFAAYGANRYLIRLLKLKNQYVIDSHRKSSGSRLRQCRELAHWHGGTVERMAALKFV